MEAITTHQDGKINVMINGISLRLTERAFDILVKLQEESGSKAYLALGLLNEALHYSMQELRFNPEDEQYIRYVAGEVTELFRSFAGLDDHPIIDCSETPHKSLTYNNFEKP